MGWKSKAEKAKKGHRPSLKDWACDGLHKTFPDYANKTINLDNRGYQYWNSNGEAFRHCDQTIPAFLDAKITSPQEFHTNYEAKAIPCVISNVPEGWDVPPPPKTPPGSSSLSSSRHHRGNVAVAEEKKDCGNGYGSVAGNSSNNGSNNDNDIHTLHAWKALERWRLTELENDSDLRDRALKCGEDDDGKSIRMKLKYFLKYLWNNKDDSPLYIFDSSFDEDRLAKRLLHDYRVPTYFNEDLFHLVGEKRRPPYRWFLVGPERSGTCVHIDPLATSAWNTLIVGKKRWVLFPPHVPKSVVKGKGHIKKHEDDEAVHYFTFILPRIRKAAISSGGMGKYENFECYEFTQYEGETVFIPNGWWHAVLNLTHTVGITQNFCSQRNFDDVWIKTRTGRKKMAYRWLRKLDESYPHLAQRARELNKRDEFVMKYDPREVAKRERREREEKEKKRAKKESKEIKTGSLDSGSFDRDAKRSRLERIVSP